MIILDGGSRRTSEQGTQSMSITAGKAITEAIYTALGPKGMDRILVDSGGQIVVTSDGVTILKEMDIGHPATNMIVEISEIQEGEIRNNTTIAVINAGELLDQAKDLLDSDIHTTTITQGYRQVIEKTKKVLEGNATETTRDDHETLRRSSQQQ